MAVESCPSTSPDNPQSRGMSPRISFSHDIGQYDVVPVEPHLPLSPASLSASASFNFHSHQNLQNSSSADELFSNGVLLPLQDLRSSKSPSPAPPPPTPLGDDPRTGEEQSRTRKPSSSSSSHTSSFWKFRRSRSCNCGSIYTGTLCPILLPRSKSTGSNSSSKRSLVSKEDNHQHSQHHNRNLGGGGGVNGGKQRSLFSGYQKPPLNKSYGSSAGSGLRVSPVLNVSSGNMFGLGSFFSSIGREKSNKKKLVI